MTITVVGVDLSKSVFQPQALPPHHPRRLRQVRRVDLRFLLGG